MRILHILDHSLPLHSGYVFRTQAIMNEQRNLGYDPILLTTPRQGPCDDPIEKIDGDYTVYRTQHKIDMRHLPIIYREITEMRATTKRIKDAIDDLKPDFLHAHSPVLNFFPAKKAAGNIPVIYEVRGFWEDAAVDHRTTKEGSLRYKISRAMETYAMQKADAVTTICEGLQTDIIARGISPDKVSIIPNAVDVQAFSALPMADKKLQQSLGLDGAKVLGFIGSFYAYEGLDLVIRTLPKLLKVNHKIKLLLVGGGPQEDTLKALAEALNVQDHVLFTGRVPHETVAEYYALTDILVYPRRNIRLTETVTPLKPLEAMALKLPVLASDVGGHKELITDKHNGRLFKAGDAEDLSRVIIEMIKKPNVLNKYIKNGRQYVENVRNWQNSVHGHHLVYERLKQ